MHACLFRRWAMPWRETNAMKQRKEFVEKLLSRRWTMTELCQRYGVSRVTGNKWWKRFKECGYPGLKELSRAPRSCPHRTKREIEEALVAARKQYPKWGPVTLLEVVQREHSDWKLPAPSTAGEIFKRNDLIKPRKRRARPRHPGRPYVEITCPNDVWGADFKGEFKTKDGRYCYPLTVTDGCSRFLLGCKSLRSTEHEGAKVEFERIFRAHGLPHQILTDNGVPFASQALCGLSRLSVWWIKLGIHPIRIEPGKPSQNGRHERMHKTLKDEAVYPPEKNAEKQQWRFNEFRERFNNVRPHHALGKKTPAEVYQPSPRAFPKKLGELEYPDDFTVRKVHGNGCMIWHQKHIFVSHVLIDERVGLEPLLEGLWSVYLGPMLLARFDEREGRIYS